MKEFYRLRNRDGRKIKNYYNARNLIGAESSGNGNPALIGLSKAISYTVAMMVRPVGGIPVKDTYPLVQAYGVWYGVASLYGSLNKGIGDMLSGGSSVQWYDAVNSIRNDLNNRWDALNQDNRIIILESVRNSPDFAYDEKDKIYKLKDGAQAQETVKLGRYFVKDMLDRLDLLNKTIRALNKVFPLYAKLNDEGWTYKALGGINYILRAIGGESKQFARDALKSVKGGVESAGDLAATAAEAAGKSLGAGLGGFAKGLPWNSILFLGVAIGGSVILYKTAERRVGVDAASKNAGQPTARVIRYERGAGWNK